MMNLASDRMYIEFIFSHAGDKYRFTFETRRSKKDFDKIETPHRSGAVFKDGDWLPLFDKDNQVTADEIIGLNYDNFRRAVIVPQGRFQEFLHLEKSRRTAMLMELFRLGRFDLFSKAAMLASAANEEIAAVNGELSGLSGVDDEAVRKTRAEIDLLAEQTAALTEALEETRVKLKASGELESLFNRFKLAEDKFTEVNSRTAGFEDRAAKLQQYEYCLAKFKSSLDILTMMEEDRNSLNAEFDKASLKLESGKRRYRDAEVRRQEAEARYAETEKLKTEASWYEQLALVEAARSRASEVEQLISRHESGIPEYEKRAAGIAEELESGRAELESLSEDSADLETMNELRSLYSTISENSDNIASSEKRLEELNGKRAELIQNIEEYSGLEQEEEELEIRAAELSRRRIDAEIMKGIGELALSLEDGKPCPVCGATEHPSPAGRSGNDDQRTISEEAEAAEAAAELKARRGRLLVLKNTAAVTDERIADAEAVLEQARADRQRLISGFEGHSFGPDDAEIFASEYTGFIENSRRREQIRKRSAELSGEQLRLSEILMRVNSEISELKIELSGAEARIAAAEANADEDFIAACTGMTSAGLREAGAAVQSKIVEIETAYSDAGTEFVNAGLQNEKNLAEYELTQRRLEESDRKFSEADAALDRMIADEGFSGRDQVEAVLSENIDAGAERKAVDAFEKEKDAAAGELKRLKTEIAGREFSVEDHRALVEECSGIESRIAAGNERQGELGNILKDLLVRTERKKELEQKLERLSVRAGNLALLKNLFKGKKFIDYAATVYLKELCASANARFRKLTQESLRLELDENNNFIIRDYLNGGRTRSVKTLSGGQTFQAAFSLSLALADSIGRERSGFFFLDEGFGSLDRESLSLVFDSLKSLKKEDRTVGVISHVEELKQEIDTFISVKRDHENGSSVTNSWQN